MNTFQRLKAVLEKAGTSFDNVVKATVLLTDLSDRERYFNKIWKDIFPRNHPARITYQVVLASDIKFEVEMVGVIPKK